MNRAEIEDIRPGHLFQVWSGYKRGIHCVEKGRDDKWRQTVVHDGAILLLTKMPWVTDYETKTWEESHYEFLCEGRIVCIGRSHLIELEQLY